MGKSCLLRSAPEVRGTGTLPALTRELPSLKSAQHLPQLDGIRGIAILAVMVCHTYHRSPFWAGFSIQGRMGVDLFFVLSGFLITGILVDKDTKTTSRYFMSFYARRILRIWPLYYLVVLAWMFVVPGLYPEYRWWPWSTTALFTQNFLPVPRLFGVAWSLCIEEQFYLLWPVLVALSSKRVLKGVCVGMFVLAQFLRIAYMNENSYVIYFATPFRIDSLAIGALIAILYREERQNRRNSYLLFAAGLVVFLFSFRHVTHIVLPEFQRLAVQLAAAPLLSAGLLCGALSLPRLARLLSVSPLRFFGKISFCLYLIHPTVFDLALRLSPDQSVRVLLLKVPFGWIASVAIATMSWYLLESPILRYKSRFVETAPTFSYVGAAT